MTEEIRTNTILNGRYLVQKELGQGGMGAVYLAQDMQNRRPVAIKVARLLGPEARDQFRREAVYLQKLHHHSLPRVWDYFSDTQRDFLVMEYIPGEDLETLVQRKGPQPEWLVLRWADELLDGLDYLHGQNPPIIHRDIKPSNLKPRQDETLVLVDFGIAKEYVPGKDTMPGASAVTPGYSPPEQYSSLVTDGRSDIYSVGATMYFLLTGHHPPPAPERASGDRKLAPPSQFIPDLSTSTEMMVRKALSLPRDERWPSAAEMRRVNAQSAQQLAGKRPPPKTAQIKAPPGVPAPSPSRPSADSSGRRSRGGFVLVGVVVVALLAVLALMAANGMFKPKVAASEPTVSTGGQATTAPEVVAALTLTRVAATTRPSETPTTAATTNETPAQAGPVPTASVVITVIAAGGDVPTSTPIPTRTPSPVPPTATWTPTVRAGQTPPPTVTGRATAPAAGSVTVSLEAPGYDEAVRGSQRFAWRVTAGRLSPGQAFELRFWLPGQDPLRGGFGPVGTTTGNQTEVDLEVVDSAMGSQFEPGAFEWGILLVQTDPYQPLKLVSEARRSVYERTQAQEPTNTPRPTEPPP